MKLNEVAPYSGTLLSNFKWELCSHVAKLDDADTVHVLMHIRHSLNQYLDEGINKFMQSSAAETE